MRCNQPQAGVAPSFHDSTLPSRRPTPSRQRWLFLFSLDPSITYPLTTMKHPDRLRSLSIAGLAIALIGVAFEVFGHTNSQFNLLIIMMILFVTAIEKIRLELRDLRDEFVQREANAKRVAPQSI